MKALLKQNSSLIHEPTETLSIINKVLIDILPSDKYLTCVLARLSRANQQLILAGAGHPPVCYLPVDSEPYLIDLPGTPLGIFPDNDVTSITISTKPGDRFFLYSDGLLERAVSARPWTAETDQLVATLAQLRDLPIEQAPDRLAQLMAAERPPVDDDVVVLGVEV